MSLGKFFLFKMVKRTAIEISAASVSETLENNGKRGRGVGTTWAQKVAIMRMPGGGIYILYNIYKSPPPAGTVPLFQKAHS